MSLSIYICYVTFSEWFNIKWIPPPGSAVPHSFVFFLCLSADSPSPLSYWCINGQKKAKSCMQTEHMHSLCFLESQSLRDTPGRLVKNIVETQTFIPFASYLCGLSEPKCCDVALVFPREFCQSTGPFPFKFVQSSNQNQLLQLQKCPDKPRQWLYVGLFGANAWISSVSHISRDG